MNEQVAAQSFELQGGNNVALLFLHGFTGTPSEVYPTAVLINEKIGCTVSGIVLPGHGTTPQDLDNYSWRDWTAAVEGELTRLAATHQHLLVGGLSMGGFLSLYAATHREDIKGAITINAPVFTRNPLTTSLFASALTPLLGLIKPYYSKNDMEMGLELEEQGRQAYHCYPVKSFRSLLHLRKLALAGLCAIKCRVLVMQSLEDEVVNNNSGLYLVNRLKRTTVSYQELKHSNHVATMGNEKELIAQHISRFIETAVEEKETSQ